MSNPIEGVFVLVAIFVVITAMYHETSLKHREHFLETSLNHPWNTLDSTLKFLWNTPKNLLTTTCNLYETNCQKQTWFNPIPAEGFVNHFYYIWTKKSHHFDSFWIQKCLGPILRFQDPETVGFLGFLDPEVTPFPYFLDQEICWSFFMISGSRNCSISAVSGSRKITIPTTSGLSI